MLIQKNEKNKIVNLFPTNKVLKPDETCKSTSLKYDHGLTFVGFDNTSYLDFEQPIIKSYTVSDITKASIFTVGVDISEAAYKNAEKMSIILVDQTGSAIGSPRDDIKIYLNIVDVTEIDDTSVPFSYLLSSSFEYFNINIQLYSLYICNQSGSPIKAFVTISRYKDEDSEVNTKVYM